MQPCGFLRFNPAVAVDVKRHFDGTRHVVGVAALDPHVTPVGEVQHRDYRLVNVQTRANRPGAVVEYIDLLVIKDLAVEVTVHKDAGGVRVAEIATDCLHVRITLLYRPVYRFFV